MKDLDSVRAQVAVLVHCKTKRAELKELEDRARAAVEDAMGEDENGSLDGEPVIRWSHSKRRQLDQKALRDKEPEIAEEYTTTVNVRRFEVL